MSAAPEKPVPIQLVINTDKLSATPAVLKTRADAAVCKALADYLKVDAVENFQAELSARRWRKHGVSVEGTVSADIIQPCVVTLEPVRTHISEAVQARFLPASMLERDKRAEQEIVIDPLAEDPPEGFDGREIDLGMLLLEHLALGIDPYPRAPGAELPPSLTPDTDIPEKPANPFQILARLRDRFDS